MDDALKEESFTVETTIYTSYIQLFQKKPTQETMKLNERAHRIWFESIVKIIKHDTHFLYDSNQF